MKDNSANGFLLDYDTLNLNTTNIVEDDDTNHHLEPVRQATRKYLSQCAIIDFNKHNEKHYELFGAHVDLSESGTLKEALYNLYNVFHQLDSTDINVILIFDFWSNKDGLYNTIYDRLYRSANGQHLYIPLEYIE